MYCTTNVTADVLKRGTILSLQGEMLQWTSTPLSKTVLPSVRNYPNNLRQRDARASL